MTIAMIGHPSGAGAGMAKRCHRGNNDEDSARSYWTRAAAADPNGPIGKAAAKAVEMLGVTPTVKTDTPPPK